jgi:uncharacterized membrane protein YqjE
MRSVTATTNGKPTSGASEGATSLSKQQEEPSVGELVSQVSKDLSTLVHSEIELAKLELRSSVKNLGTGAFAFGAAAVVLVFSLTFGFVALAEGLITIGLWRWAGYLVVFGFQLLLVALFVIIGIRKVKRVRAPERTITTSKDTVAYLKANTRRG